MIRSGYLRRKNIAPGTAFGEWTVIEFAGMNKGRSARYECICVCGVRKIVFAFSLKSGESRSCGCLARKLQSVRSTKHGHSSSKRKRGSREYTSWHTMWMRTRSKRQAHFKTYGSRGITVCERWKSFESFLVDMGPRPERTTLDRINNDGNYEPGNCRWATGRQQAMNTRMRKSNTSGVTGVSRGKNGKGWRAHISIHGKFTSLGTFANIEQAAEARRIAVENGEKL